MKRNLFLIVVFISSLTFVSAAPQPAKSSSASEASSQVPPQVRVKPSHYLFNDMTSSSPFKSLASNASEGPVIEETPPEVVVNGKPASQLTDEETQKFLQNKIKRIKQGDLQVRLIRIAPGYPVTLVFSEPIKGSTIGDNRLIGVETLNSQEMTLKALVRPPGDTSFQVVTREGRRFVYHLFLTENLVNADLIVCVNKSWGIPVGSIIKWIIVLGILGFLGFVAYKKFGKKFNLETITK